MPPETVPNWARQLAEKWAARSAEALLLRRRVLTIRWFEGEELGFTRGAEVTTVYVRRGLLPADVVETVCHEVRHLAAYQRFIDHLSSESDVSEPLAIVHGERMRREYEKEADDE